MPPLTVEPHTPVRSLESLFAVAAAVEAHTQGAYADIATRMHRTGRADLAGLFEELAVAAADRRSAAAGRHRRLSGRAPELPALPGGLMPLFDDQGAQGAAPELASAYGAYAMAVRNAERTFAFWTYVAAFSPSRDVRAAAEDLARHELAQAAMLRGKRRHAFHAERAGADASTGSWTLATLEHRLRDHLRAEALAAAPAEAARLERLAAAAHDRAEALQAVPLAAPPLLSHIRPEAASRRRPTAEFLLDCYLDLAERLPTEAERERAQRSAAQLLDCVSESS